MHHASTRSSKQRAMADSSLSSTSKYGSNWSKMSSTSSVFGTLFSIARLSAEVIANERMGNREQPSITVERAADAGGDGADVLADALAEINGVVGAGLADAHAGVDDLVRGCTGVG